MYLLVKEGEIINLGFSLHNDKDEFKALVNDYSWDFCQIQHIDYNIY